MPTALPAGGMISCWWHATRRVWRCWRRDLRAETGVAVDILAADLTDAAGLDRVEWRLREDETIGVLVNNAGALAPGGAANPDLEGLDRLIRLNVTAVTRPCRSRDPALSGGGARQHRQCVLDPGTDTGAAARHLCGDEVLCADAVAIVANGVGIARGVCAGGFAASQRAPKSGRGPAARSRISAPPCRLMNWWMRRWSGSTGARPSRSRPCQTLHSGRRSTPPGRQCCQTCRRRMPLPATRPDDCHTPTALEGESK